MKKILTLVFVMVTLIAFGQAPQSFKYQAVARTISGALIVSQNVGIQISILQGSATGTAVYVETHATTTNEFGLVNIQIGTGTVQSGTFSSINWGADTYFVMVEVDETGGSSYAALGTFQLLSVPYALHAETVGNESQNISDVLTEGTNAGNKAIHNVLEQSIGTATPDASAILDASSTTKGFLPPRMTEAQRNAISSPAAGLIVFCIDCGSNGQLQINNGSNWTNMIGGPASAPFICNNSFTDFRDGKSYNTVQIGTQCWMKENLNYDQSAYGNDFCYENNPTYCTIYGRLYDWEALMQGSLTSSSNPSGVQGVCPTGWHVPSDDEWTQLTNHLGGASVAGGKLKEIGISHWQSPNTGATNSSGFTALPGGYRTSSGGFHWLGSNGYWWSTTESTINMAWYRSMNYSVGSVSHYDVDKSYGYTVRCIKD